MNEPNNKFTKFNNIIKIHFEDCQKYTERGCWFRAFRRANQVRSMKVLNGEAMRFWRQWFDDIEIIDEQNQAEYEEFIDKWLNKFEVLLGADKRWWNALMDANCSDMNSANN